MLRCALHHLPCGTDMKLIRYGAPGKERPGIVDGGGSIRDLSSIARDIGPEELAAGLVPRVQALDVERLPTVSGSPRIAAPLKRTGKFLAIGLNYRDHATESKMAVPSEPVLFMKAASCLNGPNDPIIMPKGAEKLDWEVELGVVIGKRARYIPRADALGHIAGYCIVNDVSERAYQLERGGQWDKGKGCDTFSPIGPWLVTRDEVPDPQNLSMWLDVNGKRFQSGSTRTMIFGAANLVSYISQFMTLLPGDVISTGTPPGVGLGQKPPVFLKAGDVMKLGITGLGEQQQRARAWSRFN